MYVRRLTHLNQLIAVFPILIVYNIDIPNLQARASVLRPHGCSLQI